MTAVGPSRETECGIGVRCHRESYASDSFLGARTTTQGSEFMLMATFLIKPIELP
jgi:hypothetical protein